MDPITLMAIATLAQTAYSAYSQQQQMDAARSAQKRSIDESVRNQNKLVAEAAKKRRQQLGGTVLGGSPTGQQASEQGTMLTSQSQQRSLLG